jgi:hypothetical protein
MVLFVGRVLRLGAFRSIRLGAHSPAVALRIAGRSCGFVPRKASQTMMIRVRPAMAATMTAAVPAVRRLPTP